jgi:hypothetical protein
MNPDTLYNNHLVAAQASPDVRAGFIRRTYGHLAGAILAFIAIEFLLFQTGLPEAMMGLLALASIPGLSC